MINIPRKITITTGILAAGAFFFVFLILPVVTVAGKGFDPGVMLETFRNPIYRDGLFNALKIAIVTTTIVCLFTIPAALIYDRYEFYGKNQVNLMVMLPMILPPFVGALGFQQMLGHYGVINTVLRDMGLTPIDWFGGGGRFWTVCVVEALHLYPILFLNLITSLGNIDPAMDEAARGLGASPWRRFRTITLPLMKPGLFAGGSIILIWSFTELGTPLMLGYDRVITVQIFNGITELESNPQPFALVAVLLLVSAGLYASSRMMLGRGGAVATSKGITSSRSDILKGWKKALPPLFFVALMVVSVLPHLALLLMSFARKWYGSIIPSSWTLFHYDTALSNQLVVPSIINSLRYSTIAMVISVLIGIVIALLTVRVKIKGAKILDTMAMLPLAVPGIVLAFGYLSMTARWDILRMFLDPIRNPTILLAAAYAIRRLPYTVRAITAGLEQTPEDLEEAAAGLGAGPLRRLIKITMPLISANLVVGALFAFSFSMLEVSDSLLLAQKPQYYPVTKAIFELSQMLGQGSYVACAFGVWTMLFLAFTLAAAATLLGRKIGSLFRF
jgi:iron(III) transport system permease protein